MVHTDQVGVKQEDVLFLVLILLRSFWGRCDGRPIAIGHGSCLGHGGVEVCIAGRCLHGRVRMPVLNSATPAEGCLDATEHVDL